MLKHTIFGVLLLFVFSSCTSLTHLPVSLAEKRYVQPRYLIVTADDFGIGPNVNAGIIQGLESGFVNRVDAMVTFENAVDEISQLQDRYPEVEIGLHLSLTSGAPVTNPELVATLIAEDGNFFPIDQQILRIDRINLEELALELENQIVLLLGNGITITSLSSQHNIISTYTPFFNLVLELAVKYEIPLRSTLPASVVLPEFRNNRTRERAQDLAHLVARKNPALGLRLLPYFRQAEMSKNQDRIASLGIKHPDNLIDTLWGDPTPENLLFILTNLPEGVSELVFHLGFYEHSEKPNPGIDTNYYTMREFELMLATSPELHRWLKALNINIIGFNDL